MSCGKRVFTYSSSSSSSTSTSNKQVSYQQHKQQRDGVTTTYQNYTYTTNQQGTPTSFVTNTTTYHPNSSQLLSSFSYIPNNSPSSLNTQVFNNNNNNNNNNNATNNACANNSSKTNDKITVKNNDVKGFSNFEIEALTAHNELRRLHGCPPLKLNRSICKYSTEWANTIARKGNLEHRSNNKYGENLYWSMGVKVDGKVPVKNWYDEIKKYRFGTTQFTMATGHFTQVIWKNSKELGIGMVEKNGEIYVVANYDPPGNYQGQFQENVPRLL